MAENLSLPGRSRHQRSSARWAVHASRGLGIRPATIEADVHGKLPLQLRIARYIEGARAVDDAALVGKIMAPIEAALHGLKPESLAVLEVEEQKLDAQEGTLQIRFCTAPHHHRRELARERVRVIDAYRAKLLELRIRLAEDFELVV